ncbi:N(G),N(G)-dimethylarginine dimethylaminohydrolase 1 isoform X2 [Scophthalmus maximus]|uniref:N(G),N(G)-dimethylarginine dimethylaminohydrolase 1 isoform X2 n=1 Tax=Scophthalmus maximus TaxID=52904 RepID=UPI001FA826BF|nr:N(G),N(G)-dimethylarginine dimethylaminohydrolase 1 isoform X2 [Scophthalmus maximus]
MCSVVLPTTGVMSAEESRVEDGGPGEEEEDEPRGTKRKISLANCVVCRSEEAKYRCPACLTHSCSLVCVKKHKEDSGCSGVRDKTAFVSLTQFDEMALLSDYRFLEDTGRFADGTTRDNLIRAPRTTFKAKRLAASGRKMNITLRFLPITFTKSRENSTFFLSKEKQFMWHLKLIFPQSGAEFSQRRVSDRQTLKQILTPYIHPTESDPVTRQKLKMYVQAPSDHVKVFLKAEGRKANSVRYHVLDIEKSLRDTLSYKTLIEYPVLHVVLKDNWKEYPLKGPAEHASARSSFATKGEGVNRREEDVTRDSPSPQGPCTTRGPNIWTGTRETRPKTEPPQEKRAQRELGEGEAEEGEIIDSSEDEEQEGGNAEENPPCDNSCGDARSPAVDTQVVKDEPGDSVDLKS